MRSEEKHCSFSGWSNILVEVVTRTLAGGAYDFTEFSIKKLQEIEKKLVPGEAMTFVPIFTVVCIDQFSFLKIILKLV